MKKYITFLNENINLPLTTNDLILNDNEVDEYFLDEYDFSDYYADLKIEDVEDYLDSSFEEEMQEDFAEHSTVANFDSSEKREYIEDNYFEAIVEEYWVMYMDENDIDNTDDYGTKLDYLEDVYDDIIIENNSEELFFEYMYTEKYYSGIQYFDDSNLTFEDILDFIDLDEVNKNIAQKINKEKKREIYLDFVLDDEYEISKIIDYKHKNIIFFFVDDYDYNFFNETKYQEILIEEYKKYFKNTSISKLLSDMIENDIILSDETKKKYDKYLKLNKFNL